MHSYAVECVQVGSGDQNETWRSGKEWGSYDGGFNLSSIALAAGVQCTIKDVAIWHTSLSDTEMIAAANNI